VLLKAVGSCHHVNVPQSTLIVNIATGHVAGKELIRLDTDTEIAGFV